ncbi:MAG: YitT family protein [Oscillospiraceae bacterium]|nr:YitT family protein [Oscillospiraceae bacterium]
MRTKRAALRHYALLFLGAAILAFGLYNVHSRTQITEGGVLGTTLLLQHWFGISPGVSGVVLDTLCYLLGLRLLGRAFLKNALFASLSFSLCYNVFERAGYVLPDLTPWPLAAALLGGCFVGVGVGIVVRQGGASGGDDALALVIAKLARCRISLAYLATDLTVLLLSLSYIPLRRIAYSLVTVTLSSFLIDRIQGKDGAKCQE